MPDAEELARFERAILPHLDAAYNLARWLSRNPGDAEDIVQEAFLRAFRFFDAFRGDEARPWLLAIVRRVWYDEWRRRAGAEEVAPFDELRDDTPLEGWETGGVDPDWALFYAWWLLTWSDFPEVLGRTPSIAALTAELVRLDEAYQAGPGNAEWSKAYAERLFGV